MVSVWAGKGFTGFQRSVDAFDWGKNISREEMNGIRILHWPGSRNHITITRKLVLKHESRECGGISSQDNDGRREVLRGAHLADKGLDPRQRLAINEARSTSDRIKTSTLRFTNWGRGRLQAGTSAGRWLSSRRSSWGSLRVHSTPMQARQDA